MGQGLLHYYPLSTEGREDMEDKYDSECTGFFCEEDRKSLICEITLPLIFDWKDKVVT